MKKIVLTEIQLSNLSKHILQERTFEDMYYDYTENFDVENVFQNFLDNPNGVQSWTPLIDANSYKQALQEFTKYGQFINFPTKLLYQWVGILLRNTMQLDYNTILAGHTQANPYVYLSEEFNYRVEELGETELNGVDITDIDRHNIFDKLEEMGLYDWLKLPDGSDAWSDYGLEPIYKHLKEYDSSMPPEKVIVLINKVLDVYHQRGDLASAFIEGGRNTLSQISNT